jgi:hypothetical protein
MTVRFLLGALLLAACHGGAKPEESVPAAANPVRPLAQLAAQRVIVTPAFSVRQGDPLGWAASLGRTRDFLKTLDDEIARELGERGLSTQWIYPPDLVRAARTNPTYATDPYSLGVNVLRNPAMVSGTQFGDPLASQLRTLIALQEGARAVLVPVELTFEKAGADQEVAVLRVVLVDGRLGDVRWAGNVRGDPAKAFSSAVTKNLATHFADLIAAP